MKTLRPPLPVVRTHGSRIVLADEAAIDARTLAELERPARCDWEQSLRAVLECSIAAVSRESRAWGRPQRSSRLSRRRPAER